MRRGHLSAAARNQDAVSEGAELLETWIILEFCDQGNFSHAIRHGRFADNLPRYNAPCLRGSTYYIL